MIRTPRRLHHVGWLLPPAWTEAREPAAKAQGPPHITLAGGSHTLQFWHIPPMKRGCSRVTLRLPQEMQMSARQVGSISIRRVPIPPQARAQLWKEGDKLDERPVRGSIPVGGVMPATGTGCLCLTTDFGCGLLGRHFRDQFQSWSPVPMLPG